MAILVASFLIFAGILNCSAQNDKTPTITKLADTINNLEEKIRIQESKNDKYEKLFNSLCNQETKRTDKAEPESDSLSELCNEYKEEFKEATEHYDKNNLIRNQSAFLATPKAIHHRHEVSSQTVLNRIQRSVAADVAFYCYLTRSIYTPGAHRTLVFDHVVTNRGSNYNHHSGIFTASTQGVYTFSWTIYCQQGGYIYTDIVVNADVIGVMKCDGQGADSIRHTTGVVVAELNQGDAAFIQTQKGQNISGSLESFDYARSSFSGWILF